MRNILITSLVAFVLLAGCSAFPEVESEKPKPFYFHAPLDLRLTSHYVRTENTYPQKEYWWYGGHHYAPGFMSEHRQLAIIVITYYTDSDFDRDKSGSAFSFGSTADTFHLDLKEYRFKAQDRVVLRKDFKTVDGVYCVVGVLDRRDVTERAYDLSLAAIRDSIQHFRLR